MKILIIKQTSLGDVLHASGHIRTIKQAYPDSELFLLTTTTSSEMYRYSPWIDHLILFDRYRIKADWYHQPRWCVRHIMETLRQVREHRFDLAIDLQGLGRSVFFLYFAYARRKFVKGRWWGLPGFRNRAIHALQEMDGVLSKAGISVDDTSMELVTGEADKRKINALVRDINGAGKPMIVFSPYTRWISKDWPLTSYVQLAATRSDQVAVFTGMAERHQEIETAILRQGSGNLINLAGKLTLTEFAELVNQARLVVTGDSFPMHVASAKKTPVVALFGPTDERKVGPPGEKNLIIRAPGCDRCEQPSCKRHCLKRLEPQVVREGIDKLLSSV